MPLAQFPEEIDHHVGARVRLRRRDLGLSLDRLADILGLTCQQLQKYETGQARISASRLWAIANALCVPIDHFYREAPREGGAHIMSERTQATAEQKQFEAAYHSLPDQNMRAEIRRLVIALASQRSGWPN